MGDKSLHDMPVRENNGRDAINRFNAQFKAAAIEILKILDDNNVDMLYCDYHDDFVLRENIDGNFKYNFFQVKTKEKQNHLWTVNEVFGLDSKKDKIKNIKKSFFGKMILHSINFDLSCGKITFLTNINTHDHIDDIQQDILSKSYKNKYTTILIELFNQCFLPDEESLLVDNIKAHLDKLRFDTNNIHILNNEEDFYSKMRTNILKYSEIDLQYTESKEITDNLLALINNKSKDKIISSMSKFELDNVCGIEVNDLLEIMSISKDVYHALLNGGDERALKNASILERKLSTTSPDILVYCSKVKTEWDEWLRINRHELVEFDYIQLINDFDQIINNSYELQEVSFKLLAEGVANFQNNTSIKLEKDLLLGGVLSSLIRKVS